MSGFIHINVNDALAYSEIRVGLDVGGLYNRVDPIGLADGTNPFNYVSADPLRFIDLDGLTRRDINAALNAAKRMNPNWKFPSSVKTWSQGGKGGKFSYWDKSVYVDSKYLECLNDSEAGALLLSLLHELTHYNQSFLQFAADNMRERVSGGNLSRAQDTADRMASKHYMIVAEYLKNRKNGADCEC